LGTAWINQPLDKSAAGNRRSGRTESMSEELLSASEAAGRLRLSSASLYDWLARSKTGELVIRGQPVTIEYYQGGAKGQGRIRIAATEVERLKELMRVRPQTVQPRRSPVHPRQFPGITVPLGRPAC
jgi:hypothetical protein